MPRKTKELPEIEKEVKKKVAKSTKKPTTKTEKKKVATKKTTTKKTADKKTTSAKKEKATTKKATTKTTAKKTSTKEAATKTTKKVTTAKKAATKTTKKAATKKTSKKLDIVEYYDLPYNYNQTIIKILAQTPNTLFIYWEISDKDKENFIKQFGENFFETTKPVLKIFNDTMNYSYEVEINDFANSWYLNINDAKCDYRVELGRRPIYNPTDIGENDYIYISSSNEIEAPNDKILIDKMQNMIYFRNIKTNQINGKSFANLSFLRNIGKIYNIFDLYKMLYNEDDLFNPSSKFF